jgi:kynurenine formamidase
MYQLWDSLEKMKQLKWVELSHSLNNDSPYWAGIPEGSVELGKVVFDWGNPMLECRIQTFKFPGQFGTHIDFPGHFVQGAALSDAFGVRDAVFPLCVIDVTEKVAADCHYAVTVQDIQDYEAKYGPIPDGAFVALRTDWYKNWPDMDALSGAAEDGSENFPGWSLDALKYIYEVRSASANGHEALDTDASAEAAKAGDLACERYVLEQGKLQVEVLRNLDQVAPAGAVIFVAWPRIEGAVGLPVRCWAVTE